MMTDNTINAFIFFDEPHRQLFVSSEHVNLDAVQNHIAQLMREHADILIHTVRLDEIRKLQTGDNTVQGEKKKLTLTREQKNVLELFELAKNRQASDIHLLIGMDNLTHIEFRIHGNLVRIKSLLVEEGFTLASTLVFSMCDQVEVGFQPNRDQDARVSREYLELVGLFGARYAHTKTEFGLYAVMRILPNDAEEPPTLAALGFLPAQISLCRKMLMTPEGTILLSGPTGSGKSTTLRTFSKMYLELTHYQKRLLTTEDPVEGKIKGAVQRSIVADKSDPEAVARAWVAAITSALRLDPDALLIGELRDSDSARAGIIAALTGHIVTGTTHTPDAIRILDRLIETFGVNPSLVADPQLLIGLISQRLVARLCPDCKQPYAAIQARLHEDDRALLAEHATPETLYFRHRDGCDHCYKGVIGRIAIVEVIRPDALFMEKYLTQGKLKTRSHWVHRMGGITRRQHLQGYLAAGEVDPLEAHLICPLDEDERLLLPEEALND